MRPLISFAIPTKNRYRYLIRLIESSLRIESENFEIVIHDNTEDNSEILEFLNGFEDKRISYFHNPEFLDMVENCNWAIRSCIGEYICFLGDDDAFAPSLIKLIPFLKRNDIKVFNTGIPIYEWPDVTHPIYGKKFAGRISFRRFTAKLKTIQTRKELTKAVGLGGTKMAKMPKIYHGVIHESVFSKLHETFGTYFPGPSPDMACSTAICKFVESYTYLDAPLIISGHGAKSAGGKGVASNHIGAIADQKFLPPDTMEHWSPKIPSIWTGPTIWAQTCLLVLKKNNETALVEKFNFNYLYAALVNKYPRLYPIVKPHLNKSFGLFPLAIPYVRIWAARLKSMTANIFKVYFNNSFSYHTDRFDRLDTAIDYVEEKVEKSKLSSKYF
ncbi:MAG: hypothetical protein Mars2KO_12810 [Maribacter sp.]